ncbi:MAG: hypothetical protein ACT4PQ_03510 [Betaproteobacteria bacterium]
MNLPARASWIGCVMRQDADITVGGRKREDIPERVKAEETPLVRIETRASVDF